MSSTAAMVDAARGTLLKVFVRMFIFSPFRGLLLGDQQ
jgi:hypothetical protein